MIKIYDSGYRGNCPLEDTDLINLVAWFSHHYPHLESLLVHVPNESDMPVQGRVKAKMKGVRSGVQDLILFKKQGDYSGLCLELKRRDKAKSKISKNQNNYADEFSNEDFFCSFCYGLDEAKKCIKEYLAIK